MLIMLYRVCLTKSLRVSERYLVRMHNLCIWLTIVFSLEISIFAITISRKSIVDIFSNIIAFAIYSVASET